MHHALVHTHSTVVHIVSVAAEHEPSPLHHDCISCSIIRQDPDSGHDHGGVHVLAGRGAAALVEGVGGDLGGARHRVGVGSAVQLDRCGLGGHRGVAVLR